jgi:hypothetical protein
MEGGVFVYSWSIRGWLLGAKVNALPALVLSGRRLHTLSGTRAESQVELDALLPSPFGDDIRAG